MREVGQFLARPSPLTGESLSSWRQRAGWANGYLRFPLPDERIRRTDHDTGISLEEINWLAKGFNVDESSLIKLTLRAYVGVVVPGISSRAHSPWWTRARYSSALAGGVVVCPECVAEDPIPYYRLRWRFAFITECAVHKALLVDRCLQCGKSPWPYPASALQPLHPGFQNFRRCWSCDSPYQARISTSKPSFAERFHRWLDTGTAQFGDSICSAYDAFSALRSTCQLFVRGRSRKLLSACWKSGELEQLFRLDTIPNAIEHLPLDLRRAVVGEAMSALESWPDSFIEFARRSGISRRHFDGAKGMQPAWMSRVIDTALAKRNFFVTPAIVQAQVDRWVQETGSIPTRAAIRQELKWGGKAAFKDILGRVYLANKEDWGLFLKGALSKSHYSSLAARAERAAVRDTCAILLAIFSQTAFKTLGGYRVDAVAGMVRLLMQARAESCTGFEGGILGLCSELETACQEYPVFASKRIDPQKLKRRFSASMRHVRPNLFRAPDVFFSLASE